jgi:hypothetical protein
LINPVAVEKLASEKSAKIKTRQEALQTIFFDHLDIFYPRISSVLGKREFFNSHPCYRHLFGAIPELFDGGNFDECRREVFQEPKHQPVFPRPLSFGPPLQSQSKEIGPTCDARRRSSEIAEKVQHSVGASRSF